MLIEDKRKIYSLPLNFQYEIMVNFENGGKVLKHKLVDDLHKEYEENFFSAKVLAKTGFCVKLQPIINFNEIDVRKIIFPRIKGRANPDITVNDEFDLDIKTPLNKNNIIHCINRAYVVQESYGLLLDKNFEITNDLIKKIKSEGFKTGYNFEKIFYIKKGELGIIYK